MGSHILWRFVSGLFALWRKGIPHRAAAARFRVSVKFVNDMVILKRENGRDWSRVFRANGGGHGKLVRLRDCDRRRGMTANARPYAG